MWTRLANWLVQDGEVPELHPGAQLRGVALRASCWSIEESDQDDGVRELTADTADTVDSDTADSADPLPRYTVTGTVERANGPGTVLLRVGSILVPAEPDTFRSLGAQYGVEAYSPAFRIPAVGSRVSVECTLEVMADYETTDLMPDLQYPDIRRDWEVDAIRIVHRALVPTGREREWAPGEVVSVRELAHMQAWADERDDAHATYVLDVRPIT